MHVKKIAVLASVAAVLALPANALADYGHITEPGESLTSIAAADGLSVDALAAANGLSPDATLQIGEVVEIPPLDASTAAGSTTEYASTETGESSAQSGATETASSGSSAGGTYVVEVGDTLSGIAAQVGTSVAELAALNGLSGADVIDAGATLALPGGTSSTAAAEGTGPATGSGNQQITGDTDTGPYPTDQYVSSGQVGDEASDDGVDPALAEAIGWQESGYDNDLVSPTGAVGVMQIEPATWAWINQELVRSPLDPSSAYDNVAGGVLLLRNLIDQTGSETDATAAYYQGLASLREYGMYPSTQQYVADVQALADRFGG